MNQSWQSCTHEWGAQIGTVAAPVRVCFKCRAELHQLDVPKMRELRVTDIGCSKCHAYSGEPCRGLTGHNIHMVRIVEHQNLVADGWKWQDVDPTDKGEPRKDR